MNKTVLVTGASRGIGLAIAKRAAADGAMVAIAAKARANLVMFFNSGNAGATAAYPRRRSLPSWRK